MRTASEDGRMLPFISYLDFSNLVHSAAGVTQCPISPGHSYTYDSKFNFTRLLNYIRANSPRSQSHSTVRLVPTGITVIFRLNMLMVFVGEF